MGLANELQIGGPNAVLHKLLNMKEGAPAPVLNPELVASLVLQDDRPEWGFLSGEHICFGSANQVAVAGELAGVLLANPVNSGVLVVMTRLFHRSTGGLIVFGETITAAIPGTNSAVNNADTRAGTAVVGGRHAGIAGQVRNVSSAVSLITAPGYYTVAPNEYRDDPNIRVVLAPGSYFLLENNAANNPLRVLFNWYERALERSETR